MGRRWSGVLLKLVTQVLSATREGCAGRGAQNKLRSTGSRGAALMSGSAPQDGTQAWASTGNTAASHHSNEAGTWAEVVVLIQKSQVVPACPRVETRARMGANDRVREG